VASTVAGGNSSPRRLRRSASVLTESFSAKNNVPSSAFEPTMIGTSALSPRASIVSG